MQPQTHTVSHTDVQHLDMSAAQTSPGCPRTEHSHQSRPISPCQLSWYSNDADLSPGASKFYSDLFSLYTHEDSTDATPASSSKIAPHTVATRTASTMTTFPGLVSSNAEIGCSDGASYLSERQGNASAKSQSFFKKHLQRAKEIYQGGPPGEAELFWAGVRDYIHNRGKVEATEMCPRLPKRDSEAPKPPPKSAPVCIKYKVGDVQGRFHDSAPVDIGKPLPPYPPLSPASKRHPHEGKGNVLNVNKPLPATPLPCFSETSKPTIEPIPESPVDRRWPPTSMQTADRILRIPQRSDSIDTKQTAPKPQPPSWLLPKTLTVHLQPAGKYKLGKAEIAHNALKAKISYPISIPPTVDFSPTTPASRPQLLDCKVEEGQKISTSPGWLDKFPHPPMPDIPVITKTRKRPDSDESFACQGMVEPGELSMRVGEGKNKAGIQSEDALRPEPLFTGDGEDVRRRMTGRWI